MRLRSIEEYLFVHASNTPEKVAVVVGDKETTYRSLYEKAFRYHEYLKKSGVSKGDIIVTRAGQDLDYVVTYFAIHMAGGVVSSLEKNTPLLGIKKTAEIIGAKFILLKNDEQLEGPWKTLFYDETMSGTRYQILPVFEFPDTEDSADILFTTGTTGTSKGVELSHKALIATAENLIYGCGYKKDTFIIVPGPLNHANAIRKLFTTIVNGSTICLLNGMTDIQGFYRALDYPLGIKACCLPPAAIRTIFALTNDKIGTYYDKIDFIESASAPLPEADKLRLCRLLPQTGLYNNYGSSEAASVCMYDYGKYPDKMGCVGKEMPNSHVIIVDENRKEIKSDKEHMGLLACIGDVNMKGYVNDSEMTEEILVDGIVYTNDIGYTDNEGFIYILGRKGDVINVGGVKVSPNEVEEVALAFEGIDDCVCIAKEDKIMGQSLKLLVVMHQGYTMDAGQISEFIGLQMEPVKVPRFFEQVERIERTYNGKINRKFYRQ